MMHATVNTNDFPWALGDWPLHVLLGLRKNYPSHLSCLGSSGGIALEKAECHGYESHLRQLVHVRVRVH